MVRRLLATGLFALALAAPAAAQPRVLWPGVTFDTGVQFTPNGPVAVNILTGPRPGGTTTLAPSLSNNTLTGRETLTALERRTAPQSTTAGINGDFFAFADGLPSGVLMQDGQVMSPPSAYRASAGVTSDGTLDVRRVTLSGTWQGAGNKRTLNLLNKPLDKKGGIALYTQVWGPTTPPTPGAVSAILFPFPAATPNTDLEAPVVELRTGGAAIPIPPGGAVLVAVGAAAAALTTEAPVDQLLTIQLALKPDWPDIVSAIGGGPQIVRDGAPVFRAGEIFTTSQLGPRAPRSAVGQLADGKMILVTVDGRQPGYSIGMTNFELAQALVRLGAVTGMALDSGGSATMAFDGTLLNRPSEPERPISTALLFQYTGVFVQPAVAVVSPDGDGVADKQSLRYKIVRPSTVEVKLLRPDGTVGYQASVSRQPGRYAVPFPPVPHVTPAVPSASTRGVAARSAGPAQGRWTLTVTATDDIGQPSEMTQAFLVNSTIGFLATSPSKLFLPPGGRDVRIGWKQTKTARVTVTVETRAGEVLRTLAKRSYTAGVRGVTWNGLDRKKNAVKGGTYVVRVVARNAIGTLDLARNVRVQRIVGPR
jgi:hypothetical protein